jgi:uncharacterized protein (UPF0332 family)
MVGFQACLAKNKKDNMYEAPMYGDWTAFFNLKWMLHFKSVKFGTKKGLIIAMATHFKLTKKIWREMPRQENKAKERKKERKKVFESQTAIGWIGILQT